MLSKSMLLVFGGILLGSIILLTILAGPCGDMRLFALTIDVHISSCRPYYGGYRGYGGYGYGYRPYYYRPYYGYGWGK